jgi:hypothetical protein
MKIVQSTVAVALLLVAASDAFSVAPQASGSPASRLFSETPAAGGETPPATPAPATPAPFQAETPRTAASPALARPADKEIYFSGQCTGGTYAESSYATVAVDSPTDKGMFTTGTRVVPTKRFGDSAGPTPGANTAGPGTGGTSNESRYQRVSID